MALMSAKSLEKEIKSVLKTKYDLKGHKMAEYFDSIMPISMPRPGSIAASWNSKSYALKLCKDYFGW